MASTTANDPASGLLGLPTNVLILLFDYVVKVSNAGQLLRLALTSHQSLNMVAEAEWFWQQQCEQLGWLRPGFQHPAHVGPPQPPSNLRKQQQQQEQPAGQAGSVDHTPAHVHSAAAGCDSPAAAASHDPCGLHARCSSSPWFAYYRLRMAGRWRLRTLMRKYMPFLNIHSRLAFEPGASIQQLEAVEDRLGMKLPWELWELLRFRAGQAAGSLVMFADSCRLMGLDELRILHIDAPTGLSLSPSGPVLQEQQLAALQQQLPSLNMIPQRQQQQQLVLSAGDAGGSTCATPGDRDWSVAPAEGHCPCDSLSASVRACQTAAAGDELNPTEVTLQPTSVPGPVPAAAAARPAALVVFLSNTMGSTSYAVAQDASVHIVRGFTQRRIAGSMSGFLQRLLT